MRSVCLPLGPGPQKGSINDSACPSRQRQSHLSRPALPEHPVKTLKQDSHFFFLFTAPCSLPKHSAQFVIIHISVHLSTRAGLSVFQHSIPSTKGGITVNVASVNDTSSPIFFRQSRTRAFCLFPEDRASRTPCISHPPFRDDSVAGAVGKGWVVSIATEQLGGARDRVFHSPWWPWSLLDDEVILGLLLPCRPSAAVWSVAPKPH